MKNYKEMLLRIQMTLTSWDDMDQSIIGTNLQATLVAYNNWTTVSFPRIPLTTFPPNAIKELRKRGWY